MLFALATLIPNTANAASEPTITDKATDNKDGSWTLTHSFTGTSTFNTTRAHAFWGGYCAAQNSYYRPLLYAGEDGVLMARYREIGGTIITKPVSFTQGNPRFPKGTIGQAPGHIVDNDGHVWQFREDSVGGRLGVLIAERLDTIGENGSFQPGLSGNDCATGVMITDTNGGLWSNIDPSDSLGALRRIMEDNKTGEASSDTDRVQTSAKLTPLRTMPNLIAEGNLFDIGDDHGHIYSFHRGISFTGGYGVVPDTTRDGGTPVIFGGDHSDTLSLSTKNGVSVDGSGSLTLSENGMKETIKGLQPWQYLRNKRPRLFREPSIRNRKRLILHQPHESGLRQGPTGQR